MRYHSIRAASRLYARMGLPLYLCRTSVLENVRYSRMAVFGVRRVAAWAVVSASERPHNADGVHPRQVVGQPREHRHAAAAGSHAFLTAAAYACPPAAEWFLSMRTRPAMMASASSTSARTSSGPPAAPHAPSSSVAPTLSAGALAAIAPRRPRGKCGARKSRPALTELISRCARRSTSTRAAA